ncbi:MAG TPA: TIGR03618 family F420-dependent PPOX class oxidoreductase [Solirubrobacteraceae bacterium]|nr:TIGR03618 family F420-dependent PPOX class oxidoreductase [Solirubrobacteraceae bacterium]
MTHTRLAELPFRAIGGQPAFTPADLERFVAAPRIAVLSYLRRDGRPCQAPIWYRYLDGRIVMTTTAGSPKANALARDPRVCVTIQDEDPPYRAVIIDGLAELTPMAAGEGDGASAVRYLGRTGARAYEALTAEEYATTGLLRIDVEPTDVRGFDNVHALSRAERALMRVRRVLPEPLQRL